MDQEEKKSLRGHLKTTFNDLLDIKAVIVKKTKYMEDYVGTIWEGIWIAKNGAKKGVYMILHAKEVLEQLKVRARSETAHIKEELN